MDFSVLWKQLIVVELLLVVVHSGSVAEFHTTSALSASHASFVSCFVDGGAMGVVCIFPDGGGVVVVDEEIGLANEGLENNVFVSVEGFLEFFDIVVPNREVDDKVFGDFVFHCVVHENLERFGIDVESNVGVVTADVAVESEVFNAFKLSSGVEAEVTHNVFCAILLDFGTHKFGVVADQYGVTPPSRDNVSMVVGATLDCVASGLAVFTHAPTSAFDVG